MKLLITILFSLFSISISYSQCLPNYGFTSKQINIGSVNINYVDKGVGNPILMIHGLGGNASHWKKTIELLSATNRCIAIDLPGYGGSTAVNMLEPKKVLAFYANAAVQLIKSLQLNNVTVMGHSMGGQVAIISALQEPNLISQLILVAPAGLETFTESEAAALIKYATPALYELQDSSTIVRNYKANFYKSNEETERLIQERITLKNCTNFKNYCAQIALGVQGMLAYPVKAQLNLIKQKTLILFGENDALIPNRLLHPTLNVHDIAAIGNQIPSAKIEMIPQAGHLLQLDQPAALLKIVKNFLP
ncbi:alpha/beta fold hydrolase [Sediminibacterium sp.]|uniref:alpha/beta fold hydrolase n=1 Tax=Sediminibacterium sp. TaxID=1917865 RepID=UPI002735529F|nr:alpha/beta hydrolase [Sediminibacterium sp.]MDP3394519.1 alpha/beta hydrolase [Sediminibacterium sp.]MDP3568354.1 alpha/beta hydrolase [Sediminibacterium sp.]